MLDNGAFLLGAAEAGDLRVDPQEAQAAVQKLGAVRDSLQVLLNTMRQGSFGDSLQLGANPVGRAMSEKSTNKASGGESLHAAVQLLFTQASNAHDAVKRAMDNYDYTDETGARRFRPQH
ncbi:hypothetical protein EV186_101672 [Labedaea rhizosphaerae]|uniref:Uncharacterized protein n=1 Tax=Labedaea rhizosphaerae TaxID=598644 RepID=A0A4R6SL92_LABRH|nr:hypothetical protein EV186_101672 [Labedaea rhizosphaerae]